MKVNNHHRSRWEACAERKSAICAESGAAFTELALAFPVLFLLFSGIFVVGELIKQSIITVQNAYLIGTLAGSVDPGSANVRANQMIALLNDLQKHPLFNIHLAPHEDDPSATARVYFDPASKTVKVRVTGETMPIFDSKIVDVSFAAPALSTADEIGDIQGAVNICLYDCWGQPRMIMGSCAAEPAAAPEVRDPCPF